MNSFDVNLSINARVRTESGLTSLTTIQGVMCYTSISYGVRCVGVETTARSAKNAWYRLCLEKKAVSDRGSGHGEVTNGGDLLGELLYNHSFLSDRVDSENQELPEPPAPVRVSNR